MQTVTIIDDDAHAELDGVRLVRDGVLVYAPDDCRDAQDNALTSCDPREGRLEVSIDGVWGTVCDDYWTDDDAAVACRQLGFPGSEPNGGRFLQAHFGPGDASMPIWFDNLLCTGDEDRLIDCPRYETGVGQHNCVHDEDVGIRCLPMASSAASASAAPHGFKASPLPVAGGNGTGGPLQTGSPGVKAVGLVPAGPVAPAPADLDSLDASRLGLADVPAIRHLTRLRELDLSGNALTDLSALAGLTAMRSLDLSNNRIEDLSPLAGLLELRRLDVTGNRIVDLSALAGLPNLESLLVDGNRVDSVEPLTNLHALRNLGLSDNRLSDVAALADLSALWRLDLGGNRIADLGPIGDLDRLLWLRLAGNPAADMAPLQRLGRLHWLQPPSGPVVRQAGQPPVPRPHRLSGTGAEAGRIAGSNP